MNSLYFRTSSVWHNWLKKNHNRSDGVWLVFCNIKSGKPTIPYESAVEEALCYGWIDSIVKKIDEERFMRKFTPRKDKSVWSPLNKKRATKLIAEKRMTAAGRVKIEIAKRNGQWVKESRANIDFTIPEEFRSALNHNKKAKQGFSKLAPTYQKQFIGWIFMAKQKTTKERRIRESIALLAEGKKLGLK
ncbi:MAG: YdeI/OmpD-associated family protein [Melioribacteraceae bacterium]|nr:YdeI/OmpD-associated family protein [Melioribacteraceae bacterium]